MLSKQKKQRLYLSDLMDNPTVPYPSFYSLSRSMYQNEMLHEALRSLHSHDFSNYNNAESYNDIFSMLHSGTFPIYKEKYIVGYFGGRMMYLEAHGWKSLVSSEELFKMENWLIS
ncbi:MAG: hypothetical protein ABXS92_08505 [Sulfurimonas sp.]